MMFFALRKMMLLVLLAMMRCLQITLGEADIISENANGDVPVFAHYYLILFKICNFRHVPITHVDFMVDKKGTSPFVSSETKA